MAREAGLDLVEVAANERPPVCKIMDYGKFKYAQSKKSHQKTHQQKLKEIRVRPKTGDHDVETKIQQARKFLEHNDKVQVNVLFRGREMQHIEEGQRVMNQVLEALQNDCKIESPARMEGKRMVALLAPKPTGGKPGAPQAGAAKPATPKPEKHEKAEKHEKPEAKAEGKPEGKPEGKTEGKPEAKPATSPPNTASQNGPPAAKQTPAKAEAKAEAKADAKAAATAKPSPPPKPTA
jgi:translation initiation factor IF-3